MTVHDPLDPRNARPAARRASLVERAADAYGFEAALRGERGPALPPYETLAPPPVPPLSLQPASPEAGADAAAPTPLPTPRPYAGPVQPIDREGLMEAGFALPDGPVTGLSEEFRIVKRQLLRVAAGHDAAVTRHAERILVCSAHAGEGKTFCAVNLALSMAAEQDIEVLLVDADFAKPGIPDLLGLTAGRGLMDALADPMVAVEDCIIPTDLPHLTVLPAGRRTNNDSEYIASARTEKVLDALTRGRPGRVVLFDSPPILAASPASVLATHVGQVLMVVRAESTSESALRDAIGLMEGCDAIRLLLNGVKFSASGRRFGSYYGQDVAEDA